MSMPKRISRQESLAAAPTRRNRGKRKRTQTKGHLSENPQEKKQKQGKARGSMKLPSKSRSVGKSGVNRLERAIHTLAARIESAEQSVFAHLADLENRLDDTAAKVQASVTELLGAYQVSEFLAHLADIRDRLQLAFGKFETPQATMEHMAKQLGEIRHAQAATTERLDGVVASVGDLAAFIERNANREK